MALVQLSDVIDVTLFRDLPAELDPTMDTFFNSGIITRSPLLDGLANAEGKIQELPFWKDVDMAAEPNYSDDTENAATPQKIVQGEQIARKAFVNQGWKEADLVTELAMGDDALQFIRNRTAKYFSIQFQRRLINSCNGILADNVANDSGDMVINVATEDGANATASNKFSRTSFTSAVYTLGDMATQITAIGVHSAIMKQMVDADDIDYIPDSQGNLTIPTYLGIRVIVNDAMPVTAGATSGLKYTSVLFGQGAFGYGEGSPKVPVEVEREASQGNGGGTETLWVRNTWLLHPFGFATGTAPAGNSYTLAELGNAASWNRVFDNRKNIPLGFLITN